jgi:hypothetical protein
MTGWEGEGGGGGEYDGECLFEDDSDDDEYDDDNEYNDVEDGKGFHRRADNGGESDNDGCDVVRGQSFGSIRHRTLIVGPHAAAAIINNNDDNNRYRGGGASRPPPSGLSRPSGRRSLLSMSLTTVDGGGTRAFGVWSYAGWRRRRTAPLYSFVRFQSNPGWRMGGRGAA